MQILEVGSRTDRGKRRRQNEDAILVRSKKNASGRPGSIFLLAVADGMGGAAGGRVASAAAVRVLAEEFDRYAGDDPEKFLLEAFARANAAVRRLAQQEPSLHGMCTTLVAALVVEGRACVANVGDSRAYLVRAGDVVRLTEDHSLVAEQVRAGQMTEDEAAASPHRNIITRCVGSDERVSADLCPPLNLQVNDSLLLCSDGLSGVVPEDEIAATCLGVSPKEVAHQLVDMANDRGGPDNISVVIGRSYDETAATLALGRPSRLPVRGPARILSGVLVAVALAGGLIAGVLLLSRRGDAPGGTLAMPTTASPTLNAATQTAAATDTPRAIGSNLGTVSCSDPAPEDGRCIEVEFAGTLFETAAVVQKELEGQGVPQSPDQSEYNYLSTIMKYLWFYNGTLKNSDSVRSIPEDVGRVQFPLPVEGQPLGENPPRWTPSDERVWKEWMGEAQDYATPTTEPTPGPSPPPATRVSPAATHSPTPSPTEASQPASPTVAPTASPAATRGPTPSRTEASQPASPTIAPQRRQVAEN